MFLADTVRPVFLFFVFNRSRQFKSLPEATPVNLLTGFADSHQPQ
jgi:hypothetical protein